MWVCIKEGLQTRYGKRRKRSSYQGIYLELLSEGSVGDELFEPSLVIRSLPACPEARGVHIFDILEEFIIVMINEG